LHPSIRHTFAVERIGGEAVADFCLRALFGSFSGQTASKVQVFGGFSFLTFNCGTIDCFGTNPGALPGWNTEGTVFLNHLVGLTADVGGYYRAFNVAPPPIVYNDHVSQYTFLFGPTLRVYPHHRSAFFFAHSLFGAGRLSDTPAPLAPRRTDTAWAMAIGGGTGAQITNRFGLQLTYDWLRTNNYSRSHNEFRFAAGLVFNLRPFAKS